MSRNLRDFSLAVHGFDAVVRRCPESAWSAPSACDGWTGADVVEHFIGVASGVISLASGAEIKPEQPSGDPAADWTRVRDALIETLDVPGCLQREGDTPERESGDSRPCTGQVVCRQIEFGWVSRPSSRSSSRPARAGRSRALLRCRPSPRTG